LPDKVFEISWMQKFASFIYEVWAWDFFRTIDFRSKECRVQRQASASPV